jgi:hypothetical protein
LTLWLGPDKPDLEVHFPVRSHPSISGIVRQESGDVFAGASVVLLCRDWRNELNPLRIVKETRTDDHGHYRFTELLPGPYVIYASPMPHMPPANVAPPIGNVDFQAPQERRYYKRTMYPAEPPATFQLAWEEHLQIDLTLPSTTATLVRGHVSGGAPETATVQLIRNDGTEYVAAYANVGPDGRFQADVLEPGQYRLTASAPGPENRSSTQIITVDNSSAGVVELSLEPEGRIEVAFHSPNATPDHSIQVGLRSVEPAQQGIFWPNATSPDRTITVPSGAYWLVTRSSSSSLCVESAQLAGKDVLHNPLQVIPGASFRLDVTLSSPCAQIRGRALFEDKPAPLARVAILLRGTPEAPGEIFATQADENGSFSDVVLSPGRYFLWAWQADAPGPASLADVEALATPVVLARGQKVHLGTIRLLEELTSK